MHFRSKRTSHFRNGFTLIELMIVVAIIAIIAAVALPKLLTARHLAIFQNGPEPAAFTYEGDERIAITVVGLGDEIDHYLIDDGDGDSATSHTVHLDASLFGTNPAYAGDWNPEDDSLNGARIIISRDGEEEGEGFDTTARLFRYINGTDDAGNDTWAAGVLTDADHTIVTACNTIEPYFIETDDSDTDEATSE